MKLKKTTELTNDQAIDNIYNILKEAMPEKDIKREPLKIKKVGHFGFINPGMKDFGKAIVKLDKKIRTKADAIKNKPFADIVDERYLDHQSDLYNKLSDWSRFTVIIPSYKSATYVVPYFLGKLGGQIGIHDREGYKAVHLHSNYKGINFELQFHTIEHAKLKKATDYLYHDDEILVPKNSLIEEQNTELENKVNEYCQVVYQRSDFNQYLNDIVSATEIYQARKPKQEKQKLKHFTEIISRAEMVQTELEGKLAEYLTELTKMCNTSLVKEKPNTDETTKDAGL